MIEWHDGVVPAPEPASETEVREAERALRVRLPADFLAVAGTHQGASPVPAKVDLPDGSVTSVSHLLHFDEEPGLSNIVARGFPVAGILDKGVIPFAEDIGGDLFCFNYRETPDTPSVAFWSVDTGLLPITDSFSNFASMLRE